MLEDPTTKSAGARIFTYLGAGTYAAALILCAYRFQVSWSMVPGPDPATPTLPAAPEAIWPTIRWGAVLWNVALFSLFAAHHSLLARTSAKAIVRRLIPDTLVRSLYVWMASLLLIAVLVFWLPSGGDIYRAAGWPAFAHGMVQFAGLGLAIWAAAAIDPLQLSGIRPETRGRLLTHGPYRLVRHPLYLGWILMVFGPAHMTADRLVFAGVSSLYLVLAIPWEEQALRGSFDRDYQQYAARARWRVIPYIY